MKLKWLTRVAHGVAHGVKFLADIRPAVASAFPDKAGILSIAVDKAEQFKQIVLDVEMEAAYLVSAGVTLSGQQKLEMAVARGTQVFLQSEHLIGHDKHDPELLKTGMAKIMAGFADVVNSRETDLKVVDA